MNPLDVAAWCCTAFAGSILLLGSTRIGLHYSVLGYRVLSTVGWFCILASVIGSLLFTVFATTRPDTAIPPIAGLGTCLALTVWLSMILAREFTTIAKVARSSEQRTRTVLGLTNRMTDMEQMLRILENHSMESGLPKELLDALQAGGIDVTKLRRRETSVGLMEDFGASSNRAPRTPNTMERRPEDFGLPTRSVGEDDFDEADPAGSRMIRDALPVDDDEPEAVPATPALPQPTPPVRRDETPDTPDLSGHALAGDESTAPSDRPSRRTVAGDLVTRVRNNESALRRSDTAESSATGSRSGDDPKTRRRSSTTGSIQPST